MKEILWHADCADSKCKYMHQTFIQSGCYFMVTHHARGISLKSYLEAKKYLPENQIEFIAFQLVKGIGQLHDNNIIFNNVTTESILITDQGDVQLVNYQSSCILQNQMLKVIPPNLCQGHLETCSPEMLDANTSYDFVSDWWSLGVLLYRLLCSYPPYKGATKEILLSKIKEKEVVFPDKKKYAIEYSDELVSLIKALLTKDRPYRLGNN